ncbi:GNAT family N-acetyltransferase [Bacillus sp. 17RED48]|uniref:GNAT family N-acetyltransferase n=1 Tax=Bacillus sp. 17RED48 TaxID=2778093 RepID=UPI001C9AE76D|nr:GNAT family N-acetyltransferase [Bacillus sp. 17RED48]MBY7114782.1 GNAT family N-acetyltransferase [Bacillus sp. 17RED48]
MEIRICNSLHNVNWTEMREVYQSVGWKKHDEKKIKKVFTASNTLAIAYNQNKIIGFGRAMSDGVFNAAIYDVVIHKQYHGKGIGKKIINSLLDQLKDISCVHLVSTTNNEEFYSKSGFRKMKTAMAQYLNPTLAEEYLD